MSNINKCNPCDTRFVYVVLTAHLVHFLENGTICFTSLPICKVSFYMPMVSIYMYMQKHVSVRMKCEP